MIMRLAHVCIGSNDLAATEHFYCEILDMEKGFEFIKDGKPFGFYIKTGELTFIEVFQQGEEANYERPIIKHLCLQVDDIDAIIADVRSKDYEITDKQFAGDNSYQCWITDPSGVSIELMQYTEESSQLTGNPVQVTW